MSHWSLIKINIRGSTHSDILLEYNIFRHSLHLQGCSWLQSDRRTYLISGSSCAGTLIHKNQWFKVLSLLMKIRPEHLVVLKFKRIKYFSKPFTNSRRLWTVEDWERRTLCYEENLIAAPHQVTLREKILFQWPLSLFFSFFFVYGFWST